MRLFLLAALLVSAAPAVSAGEESAPATSAGTAKDAGPNAHLAAAVRLYQKLDLDAAIAELQLAEDGAKDSEDDRVQVLIFRGLIFSETGKLSAELGRAIIQAADEVIAGQWREQFHLDVFQAGAGTSYNMNINEVIANRALELLGDA